MRYKGTIHADALSTDTCADNMILPGKYLPHWVWQRRRSALVIELKEPRVRSRDIENLLVQFADGLVGVAVAGITITNVIVHQLEESGSEYVKHHNGWLIMRTWSQECIGDVFVVAIEWQRDSRILQAYQWRATQADGLETLEVSSWFTSRNY